MKNLQESKSQDSYHQALFYTLGINKDCRNHFHDLYDQKEECIKLDALDKSWQSSGSERVTKMAFNLFNGFVEEGHEADSTSYELFNSPETPYFFEAIKLRFPSQCREYQIRSDNTISR